MSAVRRSRPHAYVEAEKHRDDPTNLKADTDGALSFFSLLPSMTDWRDCHVRGLRALPQTGGLGSPWACDGTLDRPFD
jgi:hypothetical protein